MNIGIDIDNVISNFNEELLKEFSNHDKELRNNRIIDKNLNVIDEAKEYIDKLKQDNHKITIINYIDVNKVYTDLFNKLGV